MWIYNLQSHSPLFHQAALSQMDTNEGSMHVTMLLLHSVLEDLLLFLNILFRSHIPPPHAPLNPTRCFIYFKPQISTLQFNLWRWGLYEAFIRFGSCCVTCVWLCVWPEVKEEEEEEGVDGVGGGSDGANQEFIMLSPCPSLRTDVTQDCGSAQMIFPWGGM